MNRLSRILILVSLPVVILSFQSCRKDEGEGGTSSITGRVYAIDYSSEWTSRKGEYYAPGVQVYLIYGNDSLYDDKFETGLGGWYRFDYLRVGTYTVYTFSRDSTQTDPSGNVPVMKTVRITRKNQVVHVDDITIFD